MINIFFSMKLAHQLGNYFFFKKKDNGAAILTPLFIIYGDRSSYIKNRGAAVFAPRHPFSI
jgi:hypothetical protein